MKQLQIVPKAKFNLYGALVRREAELRRKKLGTFRRRPGRAKDRTSWKHKSYRGWVNIARGMGGVVLAEIRTKPGPEQEWELFHAFMGFLDRHFRQRLAAINIQFAE